jgi:cell division protein ZipA
MNFSTQLRVILLIAGGVAMLLLYLLGKRHGRVAERSEQSVLRNATPAVQNFGPATDMDEDEFETPAYLRRAAQGTRHVDETLPSMTLPDADDDWTDEVPSSASDQFIDDDDDRESPAVNNSSSQVTTHNDDARYAIAPLMDSHIVSEDGGEHEVAQDAMSVDDAEPIAATFGRAEPTFDAYSLGELHAEPRRTEPVMEPDEEGQLASVSPPTPAMTQPSAPSAQVSDVAMTAPLAAHPTIQFESKAESEVGSEARPEAPLLQHVVTMPASAPAATTTNSTCGTSALTPASSASSSSAVSSVAPSVPAASPGKGSAVLTKRKIVALRLSMSQRVPGEQLLSLLQRENLQHGRFDIFHRLHEDVSVFSVASMVEPGSFNLSSMREQQFPGVTFFMLLPGPLDGLVAWDQMLSCAQRLAHATQGTLQDERGHKLTSMAIDRLREEVLDFQHLMGSVDTATH